MDRNSTRRRILGAAGAVSLSGLAGYTTTNTQDNETDARDNESEQNDTGPDEDANFNAIDVMFVRMMLMHHERAIEMAELVPQRTDRQELLDLGSEIIETQEAEIDLMCEWLEEVEAPGCDEVGGMTREEMRRMMDDDEMGDMMDDGMRDGMDDDEMDDRMGEMMDEMMPHGRGEHVMTHDEKRELRRAEDEEFDCLFVEQMIAHHEGAVVMAEHVLEGGESQQVADLAEEVLETQQEEIETMEEWRDDWEC